MLPHSLLDINKACALAQEVSLCQLLIYICQNKTFALLREILNYVCKVSVVLSERICIGEHDCYRRDFEIFFF